MSCTTTNDVPSCNTDSQFAGVISTLRAAVPRPMILSLAAYSIGAYGWGNYVAAQPVGSHTGADPPTNPAELPCKEVAERRASKSMGEVPGAAAA